MPIAVILVSDRAGLPLVGATRGFLLSELSSLTTLVIEQVAKNRDFIRKHPAIEGEADEVDKLEQKSCSANNEGDGILKDVEQPTMRRVTG